MLCYHKHAEGKMELLFLFLLLMYSSTNRSFQCNNRFKTFLKKNDRYLRSQLEAETESKGIGKSPHYIICLQILLRVESFQRASLLIYFKMILFGTKTIHTKKGDV